MAFRAGGKYDWVAPFSAWSGLQSASAHAFVERALFETALFPYVVRASLIEDGLVQRIVRECSISRLPGSIPAISPETLLYRSPALRLAAAGREDDSVPGLSH